MINPSTLSPRSPLAQAIAKQHPDAAPDLARMVNQHNAAANRARTEKRQRTAKAKALNDMKKRYSGIASEADVQRAVAQLLDSLPTIGPFGWFHVANEQPLMGAIRRLLIGLLGVDRGRKIAARIGSGIGGMLKSMGVKSGVPDVMIIAPPPAMPDRRGTAIELKRAKGGHLSQEQRRWLKALRKAGWLTECCAGIDEAIDLLKTGGYL